MTTLSDNRRWITELESQDNFSMKASPFTCPHGCSILFVVSLSLPPSLPLFTMSSCSTTNDPFYAVVPSIYLMRAHHLQFIIMTNKQTSVIHVIVQAFEWLSLFILVFLLKFATDSTREIYVRLTSPCPSPKHPSSPTNQSPISSPKRPSSPDPTNQSPGVPERTESSLGRLRISSPEPPVLYSQKHDGDKDAAVTPGRRGPIAIYGIARNDRLKRSPSQDKDAFDGIDRCFREASSCNSVSSCSSPGVEMAEVFT
jgi:hypothetical protein